MGKSRNESTSEDKHISGAVGLEIMQGRAGDPDVLRLPRQGRAQQAGGISHRRCREGKGSQGEMSPACLSFSPQAHQPRFGDRRDPHVPGVLLGGSPRSPAAPRRGLVPVKPRVLQLCGERGGSGAGGTPGNCRCPASPAASTDTRRVPRSCQHMLSAALLPAPEPFRPLPGCNADG